MTAGDHGGLQARDGDFAVEKLAGVFSGVSHHSLDGVIAVGTGALHLSGRHPLSHLDVGELFDVHVVARVDALER